MPNFHVARWRYQKAGFRSKISAHWYVFDTAHPSVPIDGPFVTKAAAFDAAEHLKGQIMTDSTKKNPAQTGSTTETKKETIRETERAAERKPDDPSDNAASRDTITGGTSPSKSGE